MELFQSFTPVTDTDFDFNAVLSYLTVNLFFVWLHAFPVVYYQTNIVFYQVKCDEKFYTLPTKFLIELYHGCLTISKCKITDVCLNLLTPEIILIAIFL